MSSQARPGTRAQVVCTFERPVVLILADLHHAFPVLAVSTHAFPREASARHQHCNRGEDHWSVLHDLVLRQHSVRRLCFTQMYTSY